MSREELWSKTDPRYPLPHHLLDTASAMGAIWDLWLRPGLQELIAAELGEDARSVLMYLAGVHDIGKANPVFQLQLGGYRKHSELFDALTVDLEAKGYRTGVERQKAEHAAVRRHEQVAAWHLSPTQKSLLNQPAALEWFMLPAAGHHGYFAFDTKQRHNYRDVAMGEWEDARNDLIKLVEDATGVDRPALPKAVCPPVTILISGLVILADRLASHKSAIFDAQRNPDLNIAAPAAWVAARYDHFADLVRDTIGVPQPFSDPQNEILQGHQPRPVQAQALDVPDGMWIVMTATGSGKTEAALLRHATRNESLTLLLPTQATTTAMMERLQKIYANTDNVAALAHGLATLDPFYQAPKEDEEAAINRREKASRGLFATDFVSHGGPRLLAPVTVGTVDQALMASLPLKWAHLRLLALANSHVVVDEAHTLDQYQQRLLEPLLEWLGAVGSRVTILTATLGTQARDALIEAYSGQKPEKRATFPSTVRVSSRREAAEALTNAKQEMEPYQIDLSLVETESSTREHIEWVHRQPLQARLGVFVNTIDRAIEVAQGLADCDREVIVLHSRMSATHRQQVGKKLEEILGPKGDGENLVVVGTQAIEASLDIDLDAASTDLAPAASLVQRAGRVWRRDDQRRENRLPGVDNLPLQIVKEDSDVYHYPYFKSELERTWKHLKGRDFLKAPDDFQDMVEAGYFSWDDALDEDALEELAANSLDSQKGKNASAALRSAISPKAQVSHFMRLTGMRDAANKDADSHPRTRLSDYETIRIVVTGPDGETIPGRWTGTAGTVPDDRDGKKEVLGAVIGVSGAKRITALKETMHLQSGAPAELQDVHFGPLPEDFRYDEVFGLIQNGTD